jgi:hypothetical protein
MVVSITRLHLRSIRFLPAFALYSLRSARQARHAPGFRAGWLGTEFPLGFWTATAWESVDAMMRFRNGPPHLHAMPRLLNWCDEASYTHWEEPAAAAPTADTARDRLARAGKTSKVRFPSAQQRAGRTAPGAAPTIGRRLAPAHTGGVR